MTSEDSTMSAAPEVAELLALRRRYEGCLTDSVIPFWERSSPDREQGGYFTCLDRSGRVFDRDKFTWMQARELWMWSKLYTGYRSEPRWLDLASLGADFLRRYGRDSAGDWYFALDRGGRPLVEPYNIFSDCFAAVAFGEYYRATGSAEAREIALGTYDRIQRRKADPKGRFTKQIAATRTLKAMALPMIQIWMAEEMAGLLEEDLRQRVIEENVRQVVDLHIDRERKAVFERVAADGSHPFCMEGRLLTPGHALEVLWFVLHVVTRTAAEEPTIAGPGRAGLIDSLADAILWTADRGWDREHGGFYYYLDYEGFPPDKLEWDMKLWWVHAEALCAFLLGYRVTGRVELFEWFRRTNEYVWSHFDDPDYGEWFGYLHRNGEASVGLKGGKWKGFFHLPRALLVCIRLFDEIAAEQPPPKPPRRLGEGQT